MHKSFSRVERVAEQIHRDLAGLLRAVKDPRLLPLLPLVTITGVDVSADYSHAKVFYTYLGAQESRRELEEGLQRSAGFLRRELGRCIQIYQIPDLHFCYDASVERGAYLSHLIDVAVDSDHRA